MGSTLHIITPCAASWGLYPTLLIPVQGRGVYTPHYYSLCRVIGFKLHIINACTGSWGLYSTLLLPVRGYGVHTPHH